jgi:transcriptional regulator with XRE-family HTH domain
MAKLALGAALKKKKLSKRQFAKRLGIAYHNVFRLFHDDQDPKLSTLSRWAKIIGCRVRDLIKE